jgi:hypothetical protein
VLSNGISLQSCCKQSESIVLLSLQKTFKLIVILAIFLQVPSHFIEYCISLFLLLSFFFWSLYCLSVWVTSSDYPFVLSVFELRLLITPLYCLSVFELRLLITPLYCLSVFDVRLLITPLYCLSVFELRLLITPLYCLSVFELRLLITPLYCVSVFESHYPFGIFKLFWQII